MLKKLLAASLICASASFATWDYYPVPEANHGDVKVGWYYDWDGDWSQMGLTVGARYVLIQNLELALMGWGYQFWNETDCSGCAEGGDGLRDLTLGVRYQLAPEFNVFLDFNLPIGGDEVTSDEIAFYVGGQFSRGFTPDLNFGVEAAIDWGLEHDDYERGLDIVLGAEVGYSLANVAKLPLTPYLGLEFKYRLTDSEWDEYDQDDSGENQINIWLGLEYALVDNMALAFELWVRSGSQYIDGDATGLKAYFDFGF